MATFLSDDVLDNGLEELTTFGNRFDVCSQQPTTYTQATSTYSLGNKTGITISAPQDRSPTGRKVIMSAITGGTITADGVALYWAITDTAGSRLLAVQSLAAARVVTLGNPFTSLPAEIGIPDPVTT